VEFELIFVTSKKMSCILADDKIKFVISWCKACSVFMRTVYMSSV